MAKSLISEIDQFLAESGMPEYRLGWLAVNNRRLVERLRAGGRIWPDTEEKVRAFIASQRQNEAA